MMCACKVNSLHCLTSCVTVLVGRVLELYCLTSYVCVWIFKESGAVLLNSSHRNERFLPHRLLS